MKLRTVLVWIFILKTVIARDVEIDSFQALPDTDPEFVSFGTIRVTRKDRTTFVISGDMEYLRNFGNEYQIKTEISNSEGKTLIKNVLPACEFFKKDKMTWPQIVANSNVPKNAPCPFPKGKYSVKDLVVDTKQIPKGTLPGAYKARLSIMDGEKLIAGFELKLTIKGI